ncbi:molybdate ABC transporter substrate-binding protein [Sphingomonas xinjiangensis]|uniref:Molybdate transport system substrate-binding protein n=1 Tax=Sphingomonas xinjiangensis TaxID=643568 RepID=A0A840YQ18_9SPHN|nr:molybdate ABC transporter substrate-binding protein [Sphingomonas xinjiangensis]MBB5710691.1 molybdate transport system substrate-binding protein [Sphingomonas xinjiangensis]
MSIDRRSLLAGIGALAIARPACAVAPAPLVLAAASLQESMNAAANAWARKGHARPILSFAGSSALARQVASGAPADLFLSADEPWMDYVQQRGLLMPGSRVPFLGNRLVVVQSAGAPRIAANVPLARVLAQGRIAMADVEAVPAGRYGKAALGRLGLWNSVQSRVVRAENVRAALALVERGAAEWGIVYATDARTSRRVRAFRMFPANSHLAIRYPVARLKASRSLDAEPLRRFLVSREGKAIFARFGFQPL